MRSSRVGSGRHQDVTPAMQRCLDLILDGIRQEKIAPRASEIARRLGLRNSSVQKSLSDLQALGMINRDRCGNISLASDVADSRTRTVGHTPRAPGAGAPRRLMPMINPSAGAIEPDVRSTLPDDVWDGVKLAPGEVCGDCWRYRSCRDLLGRKPDDQVCNWSPSRWRDREEQVS